MLKKYDELQKELRSYGLTNGSVLGRHIGIMDEAADAIDDLENHIAGFDEFDFILAYIQENCFDEEICCDQLRMLWTAFCLHYDIDADTHAYNQYLLELWKRLQETRDGTSEWDDFDRFEIFMCKYLV